MTIADCESWSLPPRGRQRAGTGGGGQRGQRRVSVHALNAAAIERGHHAAARGLPGRRAVERHDAGHRAQGDAHPHKLPGPVVVRQSSDILATDDRPVVAAVEFIRENACQRIQVSDVARHVGLSPTAIGQRLRKVLGRTVYQEIQRVQIDRVRELLSESDLPLKQIARHCGFKYTQHMARVFREATGRTLMEYRRQTRM